MTSPKFLLVDIVLLTAGAAATLCENSPRNHAAPLPCAVELMGADRERMILVIEGSDLPSAVAVHKAINGLFQQEAVAAVGTPEHGWEVLFLPPSGSID